MSDKGTKELAADERRDHIECLLEEVAGAICELDLLIQKNVIFWPRNTRDNLNALQRRRLEREKQEELDRRKAATA